MGRRSQGVWVLLGVWGRIIGIGRSYDGVVTWFSQYYRGREVGEEHWVVRHNTILYLIYSSIQLYTK